MDAVAGYKFLSYKQYVKNDRIGLIGWSWGGSSALFALKGVRRLSLPNGGFKGTITFYPNLKYLKGNPQWDRSGPIGQPTLILYGKDDVLESVGSYKKLIAEENPSLVSVVGYAGATRKFDELGKLRTRSHPRVGEFTKAFHRPSFEDSVKRVDEFLKKHFLK
jgi:dienelactone hydrolase